MLKRSIRITALLLLVVGATLPAAWAQAPTIGYTNQEALLANMPEMEGVQQQLQQAAQTAQEQLMQQQQDFQGRVEQYQKQQALLSEERRAEREQELQQLNAELQQAARQQDQQLAQREQELMEPLLTKLQDAITAVAEQRGLDVVLRSQAMLYANEDRVVNITRDVAQNLGIQVDEEASASTN